MTTTQYPPTPWDDEIAILTAKAQSPDTVRRLGLLRARCLGYWEAQALLRQAQGELLEAAMAVHERLLYTNFERVLTPEQTADLAEWNSALGKAIAQARRSSAMTTTVDLKETLRLHDLWLSADSEGVRADLRGADLRGAILRGADLRGADLRGAILRGAILGPGVKYAVIGPQGSRGDSISYFYGPDRDEAHTGCFTGTLAELKASVVAKHHGTKHERDYLRAIAYLESLRKE